MKHVRVATYEIRQGSFQEQPGFIRYGLADLGGKSCLSFSMWETREDAEAAAPVATSWVRDHLSDRVVLLSSVIGDLAFYEGVPATL